MTLNPPSNTTTQETILAQYQAERPGADDTRFSDLWLFSRIMARLVTRMHTSVSRALNALFPNTSFDEYLDKWLFLVGAPNGSGGYGRIIARTTDSIDDALTVTATGATADLDGQQLEDSGGRLYEIDESHAFAGAGSYAFQLVSVDTGLECNLAAGTTLTFVSPPANVNSTATLALALTGAADRETDAEGRARLIRLLQTPPTSGNVADWARVIEAVSPGQLKAYVWPKRELQPYGYGRTDYCALLVGQTRDGAHIGSADDIYGEIGDAVEDELPVLLFRNSRQLTISNQATDVTITYTLADDATDDKKCDWDAEGNKTSVIGNDAGGPEIDCGASVCSPTITNGLEVGHKVVINGIEGTVTAVNVGADPSVFEVSDWPDEWGSGADSLLGYYVTSGGGLVGSETYTVSTGEIEGYGVHQSLLDYCDSRGPAKGTYAAGAQIVGWDDTFRVQGIISDVVQFGDGSIVNVDVDDIGAGGSNDFAPTAGSGTSTQRLTAGIVVVWQVYA